MYFLKRYLVYKKCPALYFEDYKEQKIVFNPASNAHSLVILDDEQQQVFNEVDGKSNIENIVKKLKHKIPEEYVKDTLKYLIYRNIIYTFDFEKKPGTLKKSDFKDFSLSLEQTSSCNLACEYCFVEDKENKYLDFENGKKYLEKVFYLHKKNKGKELEILFTGGEPMLNFDNMVKLINFANENQKKYKIKKIDYNMVTNGTLLDEKKVKLLKDLNIETTLSFDGLEEYSISRKYIDGSNAFNDIMRGYNLLKEQNIDFCVNIVINPLNIKGLPQFIEFLAKDQSRFSLLFLLYPPTENPDLVVDFSVFNENMKQVFTFVRENIENYPVLKRCTIFDNINIKQASLHNCSVECGKNFYIKTDGSCRNACFTDIHFGHILDKDIEKKLKTVKPKYNVSVEEKENCKDCQWKYICAGGCPASTWNKYKTVYRESPMCEFIKEMIPELIKIEAEKDLIQRKHGLMC